MSRPTISACIVSVPSKVWIDLDVAHVADHVVLEQDAVAAEQVARLGDHLARLARVVELRQPRDGVREPAGRPPGARAACSRAACAVTSASIFTSRSWTIWKRAQRPAELLALLAVGQRGVVRGDRVPERAPGAGDARRDEHAAGVLEALGARQTRRLGHAHAVEPDVGLPDRARGALARHRRRLEPGHVLLDQEPLDLAVLVRARPHHDDVGDRARCRSSAWRRRAPSRSPSRRAVVSSATESEPWSGSVSAKAPTASSRAIAGSQRFFCSSEPCMSIDFMASPDCTPRNVPRLPSPRCSSMLTRPRASGAHARAAVALGCPRRSSPSSGEAAQQRPRQLRGLPVLVDDRQDLAVDEAARDEKCSHSSSLNSSRSWK